MTRSVIGLFIFVAICLLAAYVGSRLTRPSIPGWYADFHKPTWTPPNWVFAPVWTTLYLMMAVAGWLVWRSWGLRAAAFPLSLFAVQLALTIGWSALFFQRRMPGAAFAEIVLLWFMILATVLAFYGFYPLSAWLMVPYLCWVAYASLLNFAIWRMNPSNL